MAQLSGQMSQIWLVWRGTTVASPRHVLPTEAFVTPLLRAAATTLCAVTLTAFLIPAEVDAQPRQAVPRAAVPARPIAHHGGYYRGPAVYRSYYANPYWYGGFYP